MSSMLAGALGMAATGSRSSRGVQSSPSKGTVELYRYPDGWSVHRIVSTDAYDSLLREHLSAQLTWLSVPGTSVWFVMMDEHGVVNDIMTLDEDMTRPLWRRLMSFKRADRNRWIAFFADMLYGTVPDTGRIGSFVLPVLLPDGLKESLDLPEEERKLKEMSEQLQKIDKSRHPKAHRELEKQIYELSGDIAKQAFEPFYETETGWDEDETVFYVIVVHLNWPENWRDFDIEYVPHRGQWKGAGDDPMTFYGEELFSDTLLGLWESFRRHLWYVPKFYLYSDEYDWWFASLPWGEPAPGIDLTLYFLLDELTPICEPLDMFIEWAQAEGLM